MPESPRAPDRAPHTQSGADVLAALESSSDGLTSDEAARRLEVDGPNRLAPPVSASAWRILLDQLGSVVVLLLVAAAAVSLLLGDFVETAAIVVVLLVNTSIGFVTELQAHRAMEALSQVETGRVGVVRDGVLGQVPLDSLVAGDVVELGAGQSVPADLRLISATDLRVTEATLTGESLPVSKQPDRVLPRETPLADRRNMAYKGTTTVAGTARAVVTATGPRTEIGRVGQLVSGLGEERTPLEQRLDVLGRRLVWMALAVAGLVTAVGLARGEPVGLVIQMGIALAVAAVPEALPAVATIALAVGLHRMARRHALVRRLPAVETLGSVTVVCTDKTRTLTSGDMTVAEVWAGGRAVELTGDGTGESPSGVGDDVRALLHAASLASRLQAEAEGEGGAAGGDPVDRAVMSAAERTGVDRAGWIADHAERGHVPFSSERQLMAAFHEADGKLVAFVKGAPARVIGLCDRVAAPDGEMPLDDDGRRRLVEANEAMAARALRVLAVARGSVARPGEDALRGLVFVGFVGLIDPPASGVRETIAMLARAGLRTIMLTGDQRVTADAIGRRLGVVREGQRVVDGSALEEMTAGAIDEQLDETGAFSRVSPEHKLRIVEALQGRGEIVAMLGDGVNDAPALKKANVGVAMGGRGTDAAREAADIVLRDDRFETIGAAVEEGRVIYANIRKFVFYLFSCNVAEVLVLLVPGVLGWPAPLLPLQILWLNMVTDTFPALALAMEPADPSIMRRPPRRPDEALLSAVFLRGMLGYASLITVATLAVFVVAMGGEIDRARTMAFSALAVAQIFHLGNARSAEAVLAPRRILANKYAIAAVVLSLGLQVLVVEWRPLADVLELAPLAPADWGLVVLVGLLPGVIGQAVKTLRRPR